MRKDIRMLREEEKQEPRATFSPRTDLALEIGLEIQKQSKQNKSKKAVEGEQASDLTHPQTIPIKEGDQTNATQPQEEPSPIEGVHIKEKKDEAFDITTTYVHIHNAEGAKKMGKAEGHYITIESPLMKANDPKAHEAIADCFAKELEQLLPQKQPRHIMVVGLGNRQATPDRLGPDVSGKVLVTRHIKQQLPDIIDESVSELSSLTPGVMGLTGIETSEIIKGVVSQVKPDCILAVDALAARHTQRINATIQMTDTGISPGAGVGNKRRQLNEETVGCKVIAIGVPTVIDAATLVNDTLDHLIQGMLQHAPDDAFYQMLESVSAQEKYGMLQEILEPQMGNLFVTSKDIDGIIEQIGKIVYNGINKAVHPCIEDDDINHFIK